MTTSGQPPAVLILRTVSVEKLDGVLSACRAQWPDARLVVVSNASRRAEILADARVSEVIAVDLDGEGFSRPLALTPAFAAVVVPVGNRTGAGYANVLRAATGCNAREFYVASYAVTLRRRSRWQVRVLVLFEALILACSLPPAWLLARMRRW